MFQVPSTLGLFMNNSKKNWLERIEMHKESYVDLKHTNIVNKAHEDDSNLKVLYKPPMLHKTQRNAINETPLERASLELIM